MSKISAEQFKEDVSKAQAALGKVNGKHLKSDKDILKATEKALKQQFKGDNNIEVDVDKGIN